MQGERSDREIDSGRLERITHLAENDIIGRLVLPQLLLAPEPEKAEAIDGSIDNCWPTVRAVPLALAQLPQTVPVAVPFEVT